MNVTEIETVQVLARRLRDIDSDIAYCEERASADRTITVTLDMTRHSHSLDAALLLPDLRANRTEIILDLASYGVSVQ